MLPVPLDYSKPQGRQIQLALSMVRHSSADSDYQGVILVNPGGPGVSGLALSTTGKRVPNGIGTEYDWVGFDPRGVGSSVPALTCQSNYIKGPRPAYIANTTALVDTWFTRSAGYAAACGKNGGDLLNHVTTIDSANDMDTIRKALRQNQISYYGYSYGTYLGQVYATLFPTHVRRMVLDSNVDPRTVWYQGNLDQDVAFNRNMKIWFGWLAKNNSTFQLGSTEAAVETRFYQAQDYFQAHPIGQVGGDEWNDVFAYAAYTQSSWNDLASTFSAWEFDRDSAQVDAYYRFVDTPGQDNTRAMYLAVECTDAPWPKSVAKNLADTRAVYAHAPYVTWQNMWFNAPCLTWPAAPHTPVQVDGSKVGPILLVDQTLDAATPYEGSLEVRQLFPRARLLALPGGTSHADSLSGNTCEDSMIAKYLATGALPARKSGNTADATCAPRAQPPPTQ
jgi:pimeloyl-ACP methyl ester carboxylesterase